MELKEKSFSPMQLLFWLNPCCVWTKSRLSHISLITLLIPMLSIADRVKSIMYALSWRVPVLHSQNNKGKASAELEFYSWIASGGKK